MAICRKFACSLFILMSGLLFCFPLAALVSSTYQTIFRNVAFCSLWLDIPGRLTIFLTCYYVASLCGFFPLPRSLNLFIQPFRVWSLKSWRRLLRNLRLVTLASRMRPRRNNESVQDTLETSPLQEDNQNCIRDRSHSRSTEPINIVYPASYVVPVIVSNSETVRRNESPETSESIDGSIASINSSAGGIVVPIMRLKSSKRRYLSESSNEESESSMRRSFVLSKYRKKYPEVKWTGGAAKNALASALSDRAAVPTVKEKPKMIESNRNTAVTSIRKKERPKSRRDKLEVHTSNAAAIKRGESKTEPLDEKYAARTKSERPVATTHPGEQRRANEEANIQPNVHMQLRKTPANSERRTLSRYQRSPLENREKKCKENPVESQAPVPDHSCAPVASERRLSDKYFALSDEEKLIATKQQKRFSNRRKEHELHTVDKQLPARKELLPQTNDQSGTREKNRPGTVSNEREHPIQGHNTKLSPNFPRYPWGFFRNPRGLPAGANMLHRRNVEFEKHETEKYYNRQKRELPRLARSLMPNFRDKNVTEVQLPRSKGNINLLARGSFQTKSGFRAAAENVPKNQSEASRATGSIVNKGDDRQSTNLFSATHVREAENMNADNASNRRRTLPTHRFQITRTIRSRNQDSKTNCTSTERDSRQRTRSEPGPSNFREFKQDSGKVSLLAPVHEESSIESSKSFDIADFKKKLKQAGQSNVQVSTTLISAILDSKQDENSTDDDDTESSVSTKTSEVDKDKKAGW